MKISLSGEVVAVDVESAYGGSVYERTVRLDIGQTVIDCFEGKNHVTEEDCGKVVDIMLLAQRSTGELCSETSEKGIFQNNVSGDNRSQWRGTLRGEVVCTNNDQFGGIADDPTILLDIGIGTIIISAQGELKESIVDGNISVGSIVQVESGRIDIIGRN